MKTENEQEAAVVQNDVNNLEQETVTISQSSEVECPEGDEKSKQIEIDADKASSVRWLIGKKSFVNIFDDNY